jgi:hypothetical protein
MASLYGHSALSEHVGRAIQPSVLLIAAWVVLGAVTRSFMAARAVRAAITASRASSERRHKSSKEGPVCWHGFRFVALEPCFDLGPAPERVR